MKVFLERRVSALRWWKERVQIYYFLHLILEQCHLTDFPSPTWLFSILSFTKQINFHCCFLLLTLLKVNVFQKWGDLNACIGQCKMNKTGLQPVSRPAEQPFFYVGPSKEDIFSDHLLWSIFQSTGTYILQITILCGPLRAAFMYCINSS